MASKTIRTGLGAKVFVTATIPADVDISSATVQLAVGTWIAPGAWQTPDLLSFSSDGKTAIASLLIGQGATNPVAGAYYLWYRVVDVTEILIEPIPATSFTVTDVTGVELDPAIVYLTAPTPGKNVLTGYYHADGYTSLGAALADAPAGEVIYLSAKTYTSAVSLPMKTGQRLLGCGVGISIISITADVDGVIGVDLSDVSIEGVSIEGVGRNANPSIGSGINFTLSGTGPNATFYVKMKDAYVAGFGLDGVAIDTPVASSFINVRPWLNGRHGFNTYGAGEADGTSNAWMSCYAAGNFGSGYRLHQIAYSSLNGCAADANGIQYEYDTCIGITESGCGSEEPYDFTSHVANSAGYSRKIFNSKVTLNSPYSIGNIGTAYWVTNGSIVTANNPYEGSPGNADSPTNSPTNAWLVDSGCKVILNEPVYSTPLNLAAGTTTVMPDALSQIGASQYITGQETTMDLLGSAATTLGGSGSLRLTYFTAELGGPFTKIRTLTSTTAAGATPTYAAVGIYSVASNGNITLIASCANDTTMWSATNTAYEKTTLASYTLQAGSRYALGTLIVTAATIPTLVGKSAAGAAAANAELNKAPRKTGSVGGQSTLPSSVTFDLIADTATAYYGACA